MSQVRPSFSDTGCVTSLLDNAKKLLDTAAGSVEAGFEAGEWTVFVGPEGGIQMIAGAGQELAALTWDRGASAAWKVSRERGAVRVEGLSGSDRCMLESRPLNGIMHRVVSDLRLYEMAA